MFLDVAKRRLHHHMGPSYLDAVVYCLESGSDGVTPVQNSSMDFYENVVQALEMSRLLD